MRRRAQGLTAGTGLIFGVVASVITGQWWLVGVGLVLGAGAARAAARRNRQRGQDR